MQIGLPMPGVVGIKPAMDKFDRKILQALSRNAKITHTQLAELAGLSVSSCQRRVKQLEASGVITGYRASVSAKVLDESFVVFAGVRLRSHSREAVQAFQREVVELPEVKEVHHIAGEFDYLLRVAVADIQAYETFHADKLAAVASLMQITSFITMSTLKS